MIQIKKVKPMFNRIVTTCNRYPQNCMLDDIILCNPTDIKEYQTVVSVGNTVKSINVGDVVIIDPIRYSKKKHQDGGLKDGIMCDNPVTRIEFPIIKIDGVEHLLLFDSDVVYIAEEYDEIPDVGVGVNADGTSKLILPDDTLLV